MLNIKSQLNKTGCLFKLTKSKERSKPKSKSSRVLAPILTKNKSRDELQIKKKMIKGKVLHAFNRSIIIPKGKLVHLKQMYQENSERKPAELNSFRKRSQLNIYTSKQPKLFLSTQSSFRFEDVYQTPREFLDNNLTQKEIEVISHDPSFFGLNKIGLNIKLGNNLTDILNSEDSKTPPKFPRNHIPFQKKPFHSLSSLKKKLSKKINYTSRSTTNSSLMSPAIKPKLNINIKKIVNKTQAGSFRQSGGNSKVSSRVNSKGNSKSKSKSKSNSKSKSRPKTSLTLEKINLKLQKCSFRRDEILQTRAEDRMAKEIERKMRQEELIKKVRKERAEMMTARKLAARVRNYYINSNKNK